MIFTPLGSDDDGIDRDRGGSHLGMLCILFGAISGGIMGGLIGFVLGFGVATGLGLGQ